MKIDFESFLMEKHAEEHVGTKETLVDGFDDWLFQLSADEFINYANEYAEEVLKKYETSNIKK